MSDDVHVCYDPYGCGECWIPTPRAHGDYNNRHIRQQRFAWWWATQHGWTWRVK